MSATRRATRVRPTTPPERTPTGSTVFAVQRACDGCHGLLGNVTADEMDRAVAGLPTLSVVREHGCAR